MRDLLRLIRRTRENYGALLIGLLAGLATAMFTPMTAEIGAIVMRELKTAKELAAQGLLGRRVALFAAGLIGLALVRGLTTYASRYFLARAAQATRMRPSLCCFCSSRVMGVLIEFWALRRKPCKPHGNPACSDGLDEMRRFHHVARHEHRPPTCR